MTEPTTSNLDELLARLTESGEPVDETTRAVLQQMNEAEKRIVGIRGNVHRGVRKREGRFRL